MKKLILFLSLLIALPSVSLAEPQSKSWTQKIKDIFANKGVIAGITIGLAAVIGITSTVFGYRSWSRQQDERKDIEIYETQNYGQVRQKISRKEHQLLVQELLPALRELHIDEYAIDYFKHGLNPSRDRIVRGFTELVLNRLVEAQPTANDNVQEFYKKKFEVVQKLVNAGVYPNGATQSGFSSILRTAVSSSQNTIAKFLIDKGALSLENHNGHDRDAVLIGAVSIKNWDMVLYMLEHNIEIASWNQVLEKIFAYHGSELFTASEKENMLQELRKMPNVKDLHGILLYDAIDQYENQEVEGSLR